MKIRGLLAAGLLALVFASGAASAQTIVLPCTQVANVNNGVQGCQPVSAAAPLPVAGTFSASPGTTVPVSQSAGTIAAGGTFQIVLAANSSRTACVLQNTSAHTGYVYWYSGTPTLLNSLQLTAGSVFQCQNQGGTPIKTAIQYTTGTTSDPYVVTENQ